MSNDIINAPANTVGAVSTGRLAALAAAAKEAAAKERPSLSKISLKAGIISYGGQPVKDNALEVIILAAIYKNVYYKGKYDPNNIVNPNCFAFSETDNDLAPSDVVTSPVNAACDGCPNNEWGSDPSGGRGKACKEGRRLVLLPATVLNDADPIKAIKEGELAIVDLPVMSVKNYSSYVNILAASIGLPAWACVTRLTTKPDAKSQFRVEFQGIKGVGSEDILDALETRKTDAIRIGLLGFDTVADESEAPPEGEGDGSKGKKAKKF